MPKTHLYSNLDLPLTWLNIFLKFRQPYLSSNNSMDYSQLFLVPTADKISLNRLVFTGACFKNDAMHCIIEILQDYHSRIQSASHSIDIAQENTPSSKGTT